MTLVAEEDKTSPRKNRKNLLSYSDNILPKKVIKDFTQVFIENNKSHSIYEDDEENQKVKELDEE